MMSENIHFMVVRYNGLKKEIFNHILDTIRSFETVDIKAIYNIKWNEDEKEEKLLSFYDHISDEKAIKNIMQVNGLMMVGIILYDNDPIPPPKEDGPNSGKNWHIIQIKRAIRGKFGNVVHLSDTEVLAFKQIHNLLGLSQNQIYTIINGSDTSIKEITTDNEIAINMNKIGDGGIVLWAPEV
jgi:hypothetical protein